MEEKGVKEYELDKINEDVLVSNVTQVEWTQECDRVSKQLSMPIQKTEDALDDFYDRRQQVLTHLNNVSEFTQGNTPILLDTLIETTKKDLKKIKKKEQKLNTQNESLIQVIQQTQARRGQLVTELRETSISNQQLLENVDEIEE